MTKSEQNPLNIPSLLLLQPEPDGPAVDDSEHVDDDAIDSNSSNFVLDDFFVDFLRKTDTARFNMADFIF